MTEEYERRMAWESARSGSIVSNAIYDSNVEKDIHSLRYDSSLLTLPIPVLQKSDSFRNMKNGLRYLTKPPYISRTSYIRHKQTITTFKMFLTIVMVFAIFSLPNQIIWIVYDFYNIKSWSSSTTFLILQGLQFANAVLNCWIYGGYSKTFRSAYKYLLCYLFTYGRSAKKHSIYHLRRKMLPLSMKYTKIVSEHFQTCFKIKSKILKNTVIYINLLMKIATRMTMKCLNKIAPDLKERSLILLVRYIHYTELKATQIYSTPKINQLKLVKKTGILDLNLSRLSS